MSRRSVYWAIAILAIAMPAFGQVAASNANSYDLDNGPENFIIFVATTAPTVGNVAGSGIVNGSTTHHMFWEIMPREYMNSSNGTGPPGTMELVSQEFELIHSFFGSGGGGTPSVFWDQTIVPVTYLNPISGAGPDGRRYPNLAATPIVTLLGGPTGLPAPGGCAAPQYWGYLIGVEYATATPGSGITVAADGLTDLAWCCWSPGGMTATPADPSGCEVGGNLSTMSLQSTNERVPASYSTGGATPAPSGVAINPMAGVRLLPLATSTLFNNRPNINSWYNWPGFREPILQFRYNAASFPAPERGSGALFEDTVSLGTVFPGFRTTATGHLGELVVHVLSTDPTNFPLFSQPGLFITPTANLLLNPGDPNFLLLSPAFDGFLGPNLAATGDYNFDKHTYDTPLVIGVGPFSPTLPPPGLSFQAQAFVVNFASSPVGVVSTNVVTGNVR